MKDDFVRIYLSFRKQYKNELNDNNNDNNNKEWDSGGSFDTKVEETMSRSLYQLQVKKKANCKFYHNEDEIQ